MGFSGFDPVSLEMAADQGFTDNQDVLRSHRARGRETGEAEDDSAEASAKGRKGGQGDKARAAQAGRSRS